MTYITTEEMKAIVYLCDVLTDEQLRLLSFDLTVYDSNGEVIGNIGKSPVEGFAFYPKGQ